MMSTPPKVFTASPIMASTSVRLDTSTATCAAALPMPCATSRAPWPLMSATSTLTPSPAYRSRNRDLRRCVVAVHVTGQRQMAKAKDEKTQLPTHGAAVLPSVRVDSYNVEVQDEDGFLGDKASKGAFAEILDKWRKVLKEADQDPLGDKPTDEVSKKKLTQMLTEGEPEAA